MPKIGIGSIFSKGTGSAFSEGTSPGPGPLYKVCRKNLLNLTAFLEIFLYLKNNDSVEHV